MLEESNVRQSLVSPIGVLLALFYFSLSQHLYFILVLDKETLYIGKVVIVYNHFLVYSGGKICHFCSCNQILVCKVCHIYLPSSQWINNIENQLLKYQLRAFFPSSCLESAVRAQPLVVCPPGTDEENSAGQ